MLHRRSFLVGLGSLMAAPAIVHAGNLMPIRAINPYEMLHKQISLAYSITRDAINQNLYDLSLQRNFMLSKEIMAADFLNGIYDHYSTEPK